MKPDFLEIISSDSSRATADLAVEAVADIPEYFKEVLDISLSEPSPVNWRAARVVALSAVHHPELFKPYVNKVAKLFPSFNIDGLKRTYAWLLARYVVFFDEDSQAGMIEICFDYMLKDEKIAVKYNCMKVLYEMCKLFPELKGELMAAIEVNLADGTFRINGELKKIYNAIDIDLK